MKDLNKVQEFFSKPLNEGRIDQSQVFDQSEVDRIMGEIREITGILEDTYNKDVQYKEFRFDDGTGGFQFQWKHGVKWGGRFGLSLKEDGARKLSALSYYDNSSFGSENIRSNELANSSIETWKDLDTSMLVEIWSQLKPMVIKNEAGARKALSREAKAQADYYRGKADTGRIGYGLSSQPRMRNESVNEMDMNDPIMVKMRAAKDKKPDFGKAYGDAVKTAYGNDKNAKKLAFLKKERAQLMRDMEQEAEPEGGPIADEYGSKLNRIDSAIAKLSGRKEMTYDQAIAEATDSFAGSDPKAGSTIKSTGFDPIILKLKAERARIMRDMEQEAEPEGGPIADEYGRKLDRIDRAIRKEMTYDQAIAEAKVDYDFSERELIRVLRQLKRGASTEIDMIKAFTKALGRDITKDELFSEAIAEAKFKKGDKVTYLGHPAVVTATKEYNGRNFVSVNYDKGTGATKASMILTTSGDVKAINEASKEDQLKIARAAFEKAEQDGDIRKQELALAAIDLIKDNISETITESTSQYPNFEVDRNIKYQDTVISKGYWVYTDTEQGGKGVYRNLMNDQILGFSKDDFDMFRKHLSSHFNIIESLDENILETVKLGEGMIEEELCAKGKAYRKRRMAAGEKSSAYLSGRAVKVCKGQMSGKKKKK